MKNNIVIIGAGKIGQAIAHSIEKKDVSIFWWDTDPAKSQTLTPLSESIPKAEIVFLCPPSWAIREVLVEIKPFLSPNTILVSPSKGLEQKTGLRIDEVVEDVTPGQPFGFLLGSMLADEMMRNEPAVAAFASKSEIAQSKVVDLFKDTELFIHPTSDVCGAGYSAVVKNIYAILMGIVDGLGHGDNVKGFIASRAINEMQSLICALGGHEKTCGTAPGIGDFLTTAYSPLSRNRTVGRAIIKNEAFPRTAEGVVSLPILVSRLGDELSKYPLLKALSEIVNKETDPKEKILSLLK
jgi:glycerol-3-phosphate dehydrogenase (NAD(P)+)